jgi:folate-dependent phosphoribosylglycinamide formyltransferase PurN
VKIVFITGSHPRHLSMARAVARSGGLSGLVLEEREKHVPEPPGDLAPATRALFERHFADRAAAEARFHNRAADDVFDRVEAVNVSREGLNGPRVWDFIDRHRPDLLLSYGVHKLDPATLAHAKGRCWNIHGGLSPWYRGVITHFWPSYMLEPQMTGMTVHETTEAIDGGDVVHQNTAALVRGDGIHDLACRAVAGLAAEIPELLARFAAGRLKPAIRQKTTGRLWRSADWRPAHLHLIYDFYGNRIVDRFLDDEFPGTAPRLIRQF